MAGRPPIGARAAYGRSTRFWLNAFPLRWRAQYGEDVVGLLGELAPPESRHLDRRTALDLLRCGWAARQRGRPDLGSWVLYRLFDLPIRGSSDWVADDIDGRWYLLRHLALAWLIGAGMLAWELADPRGKDTGSPPHLPRALRAKVPCGARPRLTR